MNNGKEILQIIGKKLKQVRQENKVTIREMAIKLGVTQNTIVNFEKGESNNLVLFLNYCYLFDDRIGLFDEWLGVNMTNEDKRIIKYDI